MNRKNYLICSKGRWYVEWHETEYVGGEEKIVKHRQSLGIRGRSDDKKSRALAVRALAAIEAYQRNVDDALSEVTVDGYLQRWLAETNGTVTPNTHRLYSIWAQHFTAFMGKKKLEDLRHEDVERWRSALLQHFTESSINTGLRCIRVAFNRAVRLGHIVRSPLASVKPFKTAKHDDVFPPFWTAEQFAQFIETVGNGRYRLAFCLVFYAGLRAGEAAALRWEDVNGDHLVITSYEGHRTKSGKTRKVPISSALAKELRRWERGSGPILRAERDIPKGEKFSSAFAMQLRRYSATHPDRPLPFIRMHGLRHSFATRCAEQGMPLPVLQKILGHADIATTAMYMHVQADSALAIAERLMRDM